VSNTGLKVTDEKPEATPSATEKRPAKGAESGKAKVKAKGHES
jgi:hypothetical protein